MSFGLKLMLSGDDVFIQWLSKNNGIFSSFGDRFYAYLPNDLILGT